jgi:putative flippase GtrA
LLQASLRLSRPSSTLQCPFVGYKLFVFKSKGKLLYEYARSFLVYLPSLFLNAVVIAPLTALLRHMFPSHAPQAPYIAGAILAVVTVVISFFGHKHVSFRDSDLHHSSNSSGR